MTSQNPTSPEVSRADGEAATTGDSTSGSTHVLGMLGDHVPLSLLIDLAAPTGPDSVTIHDDEGLPADSWWDLGDEPAGTDSDQPATDGR
ncbi:hypothetical protein [uncultured Pseudokineococcus sp.]|uniref:hypothetical protein n=1 Tax=uncultured Pseudokineococcus sp. TaxID=1642928 RepID=UPI0026075548|nr:hypothetical protein [uncultured Pseudokineococcus sp.]